MQAASEKEAIRLPVRGIALAVGRRTSPAALGETVTDIMFSLFSGRISCPVPNHPDLA
jgi:hypothetical protein